jgi:peptidyl-prolyl cis-trans isomerase SurA
MRLMLLTSGGRISAQMLPQLQNQAVRDLVEEQLKLMEAKEFKLDIEEKEIQAELKQIATDGNVTVTEMEAQLKHDGIGLATLRQQIEAGIAWPRLVQGRFRSRVRIDKDEVDDTLNRMREDASKEQYLVSEICIPVPEPSQAQAYYEGGLQLIAQMRKGVPFAAVAQQFSACPSAAAGGDLGWVHAGELPPELDNALRQLPPGAVTNPIPSEGALMILAVRDKRGAVVAGEQSWTLVYAGAPLSMGRNDALLGLQKIATADACGSALRLDVGPNIGVARLESMKLGEIDPRFREAVSTLNRGELSGPIEADNALHMVYVCEKDEGLGLPSREAIEDRIYSRQLTRIAQQYLRDVERKTMVDIRLKAEQPRG